MKLWRKIMIVMTSLVLICVVSILVKGRMEIKKEQQEQQSIQTIYYSDGHETKKTDTAKETTQQPLQTAQAPAETPQPQTTEDLPAATAESSSEPLEPEKVIQEDFIPLYEANDHIVGWLKAGENIDYPVVQFDNEYYLDHSFQRKWDDNGTLFVNEANEMDPRDDVLLIHGHNMNSGLMFGKLSRFMDYKYMAQHPLVSFRTIYDEADVYYTPVYVFNASMLETDPMYFNIARMYFEDDPEPEEEIGEETERTTIRRSTEYQKYLNELSEWSLWQAKVDVNVDDKLLMLVTCSYYQDDGRLAVVCRMLRKDETPDGILELYAEENEETEE